MLPDNYDRWEAYDIQRELELHRLPVCAICDEHIQDEYLYEINGELICEHCIDRHFRKYVEDYVED